MNSHIKHHRVYFAECKDFIKIGSTKHPVRVRLSSIQTGCPFVIKGLGWIECDCPRKTNRPRAKCSREEQIQSMFQHLRVKWLDPRCEWFHASKELRAYIEKESEPYVPYPIYAPKI